VLPQRQRLKKDAFPAALTRGVRVSSPNLSAIILHDAEGFGVVVSKKTLKSAVDRHRAKRRVFSALRSLTSLPTGAVIFPKATILTLPYPALKEELGKLLSNTRVNP
jgi:ribonuclease P protein component